MQKLRGFHRQYPLYDIKFLEFFYDKKIVEEKNNLLFSFLADFYEQSENFSPLNKIN